LYAENLYFLDLSVDLRDAVGDRLYLSDGFRRDGTLFDVGQATALKEHAAALSARQAVAQSRKSRGLFSTLFRRNNDGYRPTYNYQPAGSACRVYGTVQVKKVTGWSPWKASIFYTSLTQPPKPTYTSRH
jgi:endoplasmic reticulum-Golgi intermediate compartment protein 2